MPWRPEALRAVASQIPPRWLDAYDNDGPGPEPGLTPLGALERLDRVTGVVRLEHLELVPGFRRPVAELASRASAMLTPAELLRRHTSVMYVASGGSSAELHVDQHPNLFVHLAGHKRFSVGRGSDPRSHHDLVLRALGGERLPIGELDETATFELRPGDALFVPPYTLHRVETTAGRTVSVACSWSTPGSERAVRLVRVNRGLRRLGLRPAPMDRSRPTDAVKLAIDRFAQLVR